MDALRIMRGESVLLRYQVLEGGRPKDIAGRRFRLQITKEDGIALEPVTGVLEDASGGRLFFVITGTAGPMRGVFEIVMFDRQGKAEILTPPGGIEIEVLERGEAA